ncbi:MAG: amidohydrolase [Candidatus Coatesbacteria bacterium]|nr:MAG: amidohydrolase [Candidatus Coatesbacteria bacterium]
MPSDYIILSDKFWTGTGAEIGFAAVAGGRITTVGSPAEAEPLIDAGVPVKDFASKAVLPGLWDAHVHLLYTGLALFWVDLGGAELISDIQGRLRERLKTGEDELLVGVGYDDAFLADGRMPGGADLDAVSTDRPIVIFRIDGHSLIHNEAARQYLGIDSSWEGIEVGDDGRPTGRVLARANEAVRNRIFDRTSPGFKREAYKAAAGLATRAGCAALCALEGGELFGDEDLDILQGIQPELGIHTVLYNQYPEVASSRRLGLDRIGGCILADGSIGSRTAAVLEDYADDRGNRGRLYLDNAWLKRFVAEAHEAGMQVAIHAIGERAVRQVLDAYEAALTAAPRPDHRHRVEHIELILEEDIERAARLGVVFSMQPAFEHFWGGPGNLYERRLGDRYKRTNRLGSILRAGVTLAGGSDSNITPLAPLLGIKAAVNHPTEGERLTVDEALKAFTAGAARACFAEGNYGTVEAGKSATFTVLGDHPADVPPTEIADIEVVATIVDGDEVYTIV